MPAQKTTNLPFDIGIGELASTLRLEEVYGRTSARREAENEDHLHPVGYSVIKVTGGPPRKIFVLKSGTLSRAVSDFLVMKDLMTPDDSIFLTFKQSVLMSCNKNSKSVLELLTNKEHHDGRSF